MIPREPLVLSPVFDDPGPVQALFDELAPYPMLQARGQVMGSHLEQAAITGKPVTDQMMHRRGVRFREPGDPLADPHWIATLARSYRVVPAIDPTRRRAA